jgi:peptidoglycan/LPS O-acetylase OafA/YrhL
MSTKPHERRVAFASQLSPSIAERTSVPAWLAGGRIPGLDGLRALAILLVIFAHSRFSGDDVPILRMLRGRCGFLGVQVFFVLSGFLITTLMLREIHRTGRLHLGYFYFRRAVRIVPVYAAYLAFLALLSVGGLVRIGGGNWLTAATWTVNLVPGSTPWPMCHFWSLCVEEHFYLLWPLLMAVLPLAACRRAVTVCLAGVLGMRWLVLLAFPDAAVDLLTFTRIDDIAFGCGLAFLAQDAVWRARLGRIADSGRWRTVVIASFLVSQIVFSNVVGSRLLPHVMLQIGIGLANDINALTIVVLMWFVLTRPDGFWGRLLNHPLAVTLGVLSYSAYLWHLPLCERAPSWMGLFPQNLLFIFAAAWLSYRLIEKPFLSLKDRQATALRAKPVCDMLDGKAGPRPGRSRRSRASDARDSVYSASDEPHGRSTDVSRVGSDSGV